MSEKRKKLNLDELKVQSFVTAFDTKSGETREVKGGGYSDDCVETETCMGSCDATCGNSCFGGCGSGYASCNGTCGITCTTCLIECPPGTSGNYEC